MSGQKIFIHKDWDDHRLESAVKIQVQNIQQFQRVPRFSSAEFEKKKIPENLFKFLLGKMDLASSFAEPCAPSAHINCTPRDRVAEYIPLQDVMLVRSTLDEFLRPIVEEWSETKLEFSETYGVRRYKHGARLALHVDKIETHIISVILNLSQNVSTPWDLFILNSDREVNRILLHPGEMILFESARLPHGRQDPLDGESYDNLFLHFRPVGWFGRDIDSE
ncbi:uncharacterized protein LOC111697758 [Eurytemora carolleeae]|uniref:uncharacterized protein LOC111697758 n=1 Tax=Eurytemora carolleeae TaxID=1294199 RepID=UPI000C75CC68|nr:uncharacterized protein LOC111697758 [Eurytemora carolleeae]|eukprot:XP_023323633.1 uncharacterized protein LOC111697758 [Eurytemora affinis]